MKSIFERLMKVDRYFMPTLSQLGNGMVGPWGSKENPLEDPNVQPSVAGVFTPTYPITRVSGTEAITGITLPYAGFHGTIAIIPTGTFTWTTATNIALAGTAVVGKVIFFTYSATAGKWYPSVVA